MRRIVKARGRAAHFLVQAEGIIQQDGTYQRQRAESGIVACSAGKLARNAMHNISDQQLDAKTKFE